MVYCEKQKRLRAENGLLQLTVWYFSYTFEII